MCYLGLGPLDCGVWRCVSELVGMAVYLSKTMFGLLGLDVPRFDVCDGFN